MKDTQTLEPMRHLTLADRWRREWFLQSLSLRLPNIAARDWRNLGNGLRNDLGDAATSVGMKQAIRDLGPVCQLADGYASALELPLRPRWVTGACATGVVCAVSVILLFTYAAGLYDGAYFGGFTSNIARNVLGVTVFANVESPSVTGHEASFGMIFTPSMWVWPAFLLALFLIVSRAWRAIPAPHRLPQAR